MKCKEFIDKYNLHDSLLERVEYDKNLAKVCLTIDFCYWQQTEYSDQKPETGIIQLCFSGIDVFRHTSYCINSDEIVEAVSNDIDEFEIKVYNDTTDAYYVFYIRATEVNIINME